MTTESRPPVKAEQGQAKGQHQGLSGWDAVGIVLGSMIGCLTVLSILDGIPPGQWLLFLIQNLFSLLVSVSLIIPSKHYGRGAGRALGLAVSTFTTGASILLVAIAVRLVVESGSKSDPEGIGLLIGPVVVLLFVVPLVASTVVLLKKLQPRPAQIAVTLIVGVGIGVLLVWLMYMLHLYPS